MKYRTYKLQHLLLTMVFLILPACQMGSPVSDRLTEPPIPAKTSLAGSPIAATETTGLSPTGLPTAKATIPPAATPTGPRAEEQRDFGQPATKYLKILSEDTGERLTGTAAERKAASVIAAAFSEMGYSPETTPFSFWTENEEHLSSANILAVKTGMSPEVIIVGAHYDSNDEGRGADDNASGVAILLESAGRIQNISTPYTIHFIAFGAEENDLDGSRYLASAMHGEEIENTRVMINLDGLIAGNQAYIYGDSQLRQWSLDAARQDGFDLYSRPIADLDYPDGSPCDCADYSPFQEIGVPIVFFESANWEARDEDDQPLQVDSQYGDNGIVRHTRYDTIEYIEKTFPGRIEKHLNLYASLLYRILTEYRGD